MGKNQIKNLLKVTTCAMVEAGCQRGVIDSLCGFPGCLELTQDPCQSPVP